MALEEVVDIRESKISLKRLRQHSPIWQLTNPQARSLWTIINDMFAHSKHQYSHEVCPWPLQAHVYQWLKTQRLLFTPANQPTIHTSLSHSFNSASPKLMATDRFHIPSSQTLWKPSVGLSRFTYCTNCRHMGSRALYSTNRVDSLLTAFLSSKWEMTYL